MSEAVFDINGAQAARRQRLKTSDLEPGDIIATASTTKASRGIGWATRGEFSHAMLYRGAGWAVDAVPEQGVTYDRLQLKLVGARKAVVLRHVRATREQRELTAKWAALQAGKPYDHFGAARVGIQPGARTYGLQFTPYGTWVTILDELGGYMASDGHDSSFFCSELIIRAYQVAGAAIFELKPRTTGPDALVKACLLQHVGYLIGAE